EAPPIDSVPKFALLERPSMTIAFNVTGCPAMSVCCGYAESGLPLSLQIVGKRFADATVLRLAHAYEQATPLRGRRPQLGYRAGRELKGRNVMSPMKVLRNARLIDGTG